MSLSKLYRQQFDDPTLAEDKLLHAEKPKFIHSLEQGTVTALELVQDCNMAGEYIRCYFTVDGSKLVHQQTPIESPWVKFSGPEFLAGCKLEDVKSRQVWDDEKTVDFYESVMHLYTRDSDEAIWSTIDEQFEVQRKLFRIQGTRKAPAS